MQVNRDSREQNLKTIKIKPKCIILYTAGFKIWEDLPIILEINTLSLHMKST